MIQLKQNHSLKDGYFIIYVDEMSLPGNDSWAYRPTLETDSPIQYVARTERIGWWLATQTIEDFEPFSVITLNNLFSWMNRRHSIIISNDFNEETNEEFIKITFYFSPNLTFWNEKYSFAEYFKEFENICKNKFEIDYEIRLEDSPALRLEFYFKKFLFPIEEILRKLEKEIKSVHDAAIGILQDKYQLNLVFTEFNFPEEIKVSCKQYLLYFAQFLQDLGVNATSDIEEEAGRVLFTVTPTDDVEALDKIREALAVYLNLPSSPIVYGDSFAAMRLQQQIENLQHSQRMAARELQANENLLIAQSDMIREKNITISQQQSVIEQQSKIIEKITSKSIMMDSLENKEELEEFCDGLKIGESKFLKEQLGIHLNPAKVLKTVGKKLLGKENVKTSILDSDE